MRRRFTGTPEQQCEAKLRDPYMRATEDRCGTFASVVVGGRRLCGKHGAALALQHALEAGTASVLPQVVMRPCAVRLIDTDPPCEGNMGT